MLLLFFYHYQHAIEWNEPTAYETNVKIVKFRELLKKCWASYHELAGLVTSILTSHTHSNHIENLNHQQQKQQQFFSSFHNFGHFFGSVRKRLAIITFTNSILTSKTIASLNVTLFIFFAGHIKKQHIKQVARIKCSKTFNCAKSKRDKGNKSTTWNIQRFELKWVWSLYWYFLIAF